MAAPPNVAAAMEGLPAGLMNTHGLSKEAILSYKLQFDEFDEDGGGTIDNSELKDVLLKCGMSISDTQVAEMIKEFDTDGNGQLDFQEFLTMMHRLISGPSEKEIVKGMFEVFDDNMDGLVSVAKICALWKRAAEAGGIAPPTEAAVKALVAEADTDKDGFLNEDEFIALVSTCS